MAEEVAAAGAAGDGSATGAAAIGAAATGAADTGASETGAAEIGAVETGSAVIGAAATGAASTGTAEVGFAATSVAGLTGFAEADDSAVTTGTGSDTGGATVLVTGATAALVSELAFTSSVLICSGAAAVSASFFASFCSAGFAGSACK